MIKLSLMGHGTHSCLYIPIKSERMSRHWFQNGINWLLVCSRTSVIQSHGTWHPAPGAQLSKWLKLRPTPEVLPFCFIRYIDIWNWTFIALLLFRISGACSALLCTAQDAGCPLLYNIYMYCIPMQTFSLRMHVRECVVPVMVFEWYVHAFQ